MRDGADHYDTKEYRPIYGSVQYLERGDGLSRTLTQRILRLPNESDFLLIPMGEDDARRRRSPRDSRVRH